MVRVMNSVERQAIVPTSSDEPPRSAFKSSGSHSPVAVVLTHEPVQPLHDLVRQRAIVWVGDSHLADQCSECGTCLDSGPVAFGVSHIRSGIPIHRAGEQCTQTVNVRGPARSRTLQNLRCLTRRIQRLNPCCFAGPHAPRPP